MNLSRLIVASLFLIISKNFSSQAEFSKWYFGNYAGIDFSTTPPTTVFNGSTSVLEGFSTICDATGNLLFYTSGNFIRNSTHAMMANGTGLTGGLGGTTQDDLAVKMPGNNTLYYVFTIQSFGGNMYYSIVDMSLAAGQGSVVTKNAWLYNQSTEKHVAIRHCNGRDIWLLSHEFGTNNFRAYLLTSSGLSLNPVISSVGPTPIGTTQSNMGELKISPDGKKLAMAVSHESNPTSAGLPGFYLFDFDASNGIVSNSLTLNNAPGAYGIEFSPDGRKLYGATTVISSFTNTIANNLYQWSVCAPSASAIVATQYSIGLGNIISGSLQWAIDGKIYLSVSTSTSLCVINSPNLTGAAMNYSPYALSLSPKVAGLGLPNYLNRYIRPAPVAFSSSISCQQVGFAVPALPTFSSGCSSTPYPPSGYLWNFGDPASGSANSSTSTSPTHLYASLGTYTAQLIVYNACGNDTLSQVLSISNVGPVPAVAGPSLICKGDRYTYSASGGNTYNWSTGATTNTVTLNPTVTTVYTLTATQNGCSVAKVFTVNVNPCLGIEAQSQGAGFSIYPNPVQDLLTVRSARACQLSVSDMQGREVLSQDLQAGENSLNTAQLAQGFYTLQFSDAGRTWWMKLVKVE